MIKYTDELVEGVAYWSIDSSYDQNFHYVHPWKGIIRGAWLENTHYEMATLLDKNSLFYTESDAWKEYLLCKRKELSRIAEEISFAENQLKGLV